MQLARLARALTANCAAAWLARKLTANWDKYCKHAEAGRAARSFIRANVNNNLQLTASGSSHCLGGEFRVLRARRTAGGEFRDLQVSQNVNKGDIVIWDCKLH